MLVLAAAEVGMVSEYPRRLLCASQCAPLVGVSSVTDQCHAATAVLIREYQVDYRRTPLTSVASSTSPCFLSLRSDPLDGSFHIRRRTRRWPVKRGDPQDFGRQVRLDAHGSTAVVSHPGRVRPGTAPTSACRIRNGIDDDLRRRRGPDAC